MPILAFFIYFSFCILLSIALFLSPLFDIRLLRKQSMDVMQAIDQKEGNW